MMKKALVALVTTITVLMLGAPPAQAVIVMQSCGSWFYGGGEARACVAINQHDFFGQKEALWYAWEENWPNDGGEFILEFDYVVLKNADNLQTLALNTNNEVYVLEHVPPPPEEPQTVEESTDWISVNCNTPPLWARAYYRFSYIEGGDVIASSVWILKSAGVDYGC
jgi:hypothetical protein